MLTHYTRIIIVRHQFKRLLSAYRNRLEGDLLSARYFWKRNGRQIIKSFCLRMRQPICWIVNVTLNAMNSSCYLSTPELSMNNRANQSLNSFNEHWETMNKSSMCNQIYCDWKIWNADWWLGTCAVFDRWWYYISNFQQVNKLPAPETCYAKIPMGFPFLSTKAFINCMLMISSCLALNWNRIIESLQLIVCELI